MKRVWRFILALSVTPLMTAACVFACAAIVVWIACERESSRYPGQNWDIRILTPLVRRLSPQMTELNDASAYFTEKVAYIIFDESLARYKYYPPTSIYETAHREMERLRPTMRGPKVRIDIGEPINRGRFAFTSEERGIESTVTYPDGTQVPDMERHKLIARMSREAELKQYVRYLGRRNVWAEEPRVLGYLQNASFALFCLIGMWSLVWQWRGVRWPWGANRVWKVAADSPTKWWWARRVVLFSPFGTAVLSTLLCWLLLILWSPQTRLQESLQRSLHHAIYPIDINRYDWRSIIALHLAITPSPSQTIDSNLPWLMSGEMQRWTSQGIVFPANDEFKPAIFAPMLSASHPVIMLHGPPEEQSQASDTKKLVETTMINRGVINPEQAPLLWTVQPKRIVWQGVLFNGILLIVACAFLASLVWIRDGVVWPWNARRLRKGACLKCGYSLSGLNTATCPECGTATQSPA